MHCISKLNFYSIFISLFLIILNYLCSKISYTRRYWLQVKKLSQSVRTNGMVIIITDPLSTVGKKLAIELAERGGKIYMACQLNKQTIAIQNEIKQRSKSNDIYLMELNLESFKSIRKFANEFLSNENRLDLLINNADCETFTKEIKNKDYNREFTIDSLEKQMGINYFGHFLLTMLLLNCMYRTKTSRILMLTNSNYTHSNLNENNIDLQMEQMKIDAGNNAGNNFDWYANSKLASILFTRELSNRLKLTGISINTLNLQLIHSNIEIILHKYFPSILL